MSLYSQILNLWVQSKIKLCYGSIITEKKNYFLYLCIFAMLIQDLESDFAVAPTFWDIKIMFLIGRKIRP